MDYLTILSMMAKAASGILSNMKKEKARKEGEAYLKTKYRLTNKEVNVGFTMRLMEMAYPDEWEKTLFAMLQRILSARTMSLPLSEVCGDLYIMIAVIGYGPHKLTTTGDFQLGHYRYLRSLQGSQTHESIQDLARGRGSDITVQIVQKELRQWCAEEKLDLERHG